MASSSGKGQGKEKGKERRSGDWTCPACGDNQFAKNTTCRKCGAAHPEGGGSAAPGSAAERAEQAAMPIPPQENGGRQAAPGSNPFFEYSPAFTGARPGYVFKLDHLGLGYYLDEIQTLLPKVRKELPAAWRETRLREERLKVCPEEGAGVALEPCEYGFLVESVEELPGQNLSEGDVIVAVEGRLFAGISGEQMKASFLKRRTDGARLTVARFSEAKELASKDPSIIEGWDARNGCAYFFSKRSGKSAWSIEALKVAEAPKEVEAPAPAAPVDLQHFLQHGFSKPLESEQDKINKKKRKKDASELTKDTSDLARDEKSRWNEWNEGGQGGYTAMFFQRYQNSHAFPAKEKPDKRLKGSVGPGLGMDKFEKWTGSKNSFN